jgi:hypothetical protein
MDRLNGESFKTAKDCELAGPKDQASSQKGVLPTASKSQIFARKAACTALFI